MTPNVCILGIDVGSVAVGTVVIDPNGTICSKGYRIHHGNIREAINDVIAADEWERIGGVAATTSTPGTIRADLRIDNQLAVITAVRERHPEAASILVVGGEKFGLILFDEKGQYRNFITNTSCAAGTGSFLDQQAGRLNLADARELSATAMQNNGAPPRIASRCAVFAKTDLIHAQQEGYTLENICDGLCHGLAKNLADTLFTSEKPLEPVVFCGGVARNQAVGRHLREMTGLDIKAAENSHLYGAYGAALHLAREERTTTVCRETVEDLLCLYEKQKKYDYPPLALNRTIYPDFNDHDARLFQSERAGFKLDVEVNVYGKLQEGQTYPVFLGIDIGSTSTKAVLTDPSGIVLTGVYTRTSGRPVAAAQALLEALDDLARRQGCSWEVIGAGTTGSGRKFVGRIIGADLVLDEITAHARAAIELDPDVDTIIEIGGQDAKFTTLKDGRVTFSVMNTVCAAGTGSFIEEQARRLGCSLKDYAGRALNQRAPLTSDRCTVFMERDINHLINEGYTSDELLAAALHAVRENYLAKVAVPARIGKVIFFQGATARNRALVAAFEHHLGKPILVSRYCHLTGALGTALALADQMRENEFSTRFRGLTLYQQKIPIRNEVCDLCNNHCKLTVASVGGDEVAFGFLCGRDYDTQKYVNRNTSGFDLLRCRKKMARVEGPDESLPQVTIGLPAALHLMEDLPFWQFFFRELGIRTITSMKAGETIQAGRKRTGAEFCAPVTALHGHVPWLLKRTDYVFLPYYFEKRDKPRHVRRQHCYYTQYAPTLIIQEAGPENRHRFLSPLVDYLYSNFHTMKQLFQVLKPVDRRITFFDVAMAYNHALEYRRTLGKKLQAEFTAQTGTDDLTVVLLGRPYTVLAEQMNARIPDILAGLGVKTFYQDMVPVEAADVTGIQPLLDEIHWEHADRILRTAAAVARMKNVYPVLLTSFMCTPDAFVCDYFRQVMEMYGKPYLILQMDEHGSSVGYETRIEAALRAFDNHRRTRPGPGLPVVCRRLHPDYATSLKDRTVILPNWDNITCRLLAANLIREGLDVRLIEENEAVIRQSLRHNDGQCIPLNIMAEECAEYVRQHDLDPAETVLWMGSGNIACNLRLYPYHIKQLLNRFGGGLEQIGVYQGDVSFSDISLRASRNAYFAYMFGGLLRRMACRVRPYEIEPGETDQVLRQGVEQLVAAFLGRADKMATVERVVAEFEAIRVNPGQRPQVAIFGDLYVRDNRVANQDLVRYIEKHGGEVITTPYSTYAKMIAGSYFRKWIREGKVWHSLSTRTVMTAVQLMEKKYYAAFERVIREPEHSYAEPIEKILAEYDLRIEHTGESMDNIVKVFYIRRYHPNVTLFVQTNPAFCCPSIVTQAMARVIERKTGVPVVTLTYDGTAGFKNDKLIPYLKYPRQMETGEERYRRQAG